MSCTKNGRIRKLIASNLDHCRTIEAAQPKLTREITGKRRNMALRPDDPNYGVKHPFTELNIVKTYGRTDRRELETNRLANALGKMIVDKDKQPLYYDSPAKKPRMKKFVGHGKKKKNTNPEPTPDKNRKKK